jgi:hypothetical protein
LIATTVSRLGPARLGRPGLPRFGFAITDTVAIWVSPPGDATKQIYALEDIIIQCAVPDQDPQGRRAKNSWIL